MLKDPQTLIPMIIRDLNLHEDLKETARKFEVDFDFVKAIDNTRETNKIAITVSLKEAIVKDYHTGNYTIEDLATKYKLTPGSITRIIDRMGSGEDADMKRRNKVKTKKNKKIIKDVTLRIGNVVKKGFEDTESDIDTDGQNDIETEDDMKYVCYEEDAAENIIDRVLNSLDEEYPEDNSEEVCSFDDEWYKYFGLQNFENKMVPYHDTNVVIAGLVADRHKMPVDKFIFEESFSEELMFDYDKQERICKEFIRNNIPFNDRDSKYNTKKLIVYTTGIQCALGSICKACYEYGVDLTLKHYNAAEMKYYSQVITGNGCGNCEGTFSKLQKDCKRGIFFYDCDQSKFGTDCDELYTIKLTSYSADETHSETAYIITDAYDKVWQVYPALVNAINANNGIKLALFVTKSKIANNDFIWGLGITKGFNFK